jgi:prefoldin subunit 2
MDWTEVQQTYSRFQSDLQNLASKIGELEQEAEEHVYVLRSKCLTSVSIF